MKAAVAEKRTTAATRSRFDRTPANRLPDFKLKVPVAANQLEIGSVGGNQARTTRSRSERNEDIEMEVAKLVRLKAVICSHLCKKLT